CLGPGGREIFSVDSSVIGDAEMVEWVADSPGAYLLRIITTEPRAPRGEYSIVLQEVSTPTETHRRRIAAARAFAAGMKARRLDTHAGFLQAIGQVEQAVGHWRAAGDRLEEATALYTLGLLYIEVADRQKALQYT